MGFHQTGSARRIARAQRGQKVASLLGQTWLRCAARSHTPVNELHQDPGERMHHHRQHLIARRRSEQAVELARAFYPVKKVARNGECGESEIDGKPMREDALVRDRMAQFAAEIEVGRQLMMHCAELAGSGPAPPEIGAISKVFSGELMERFHEAALEILGMRATLSQGAPGNILNGRFEQGLRHSLMWVISIGTNEIQRSLIAQRGLGLPR